MKSIGYAIKEKLSQQAENMLEKLNNQEKLIDYRKLNFKGGNHVDYDFSNFRPLRELFRVIYYGDVIIPGAEREQNEFDDMLEIIKPYRPKKDSKYKKIKDDLVINAQKFYDRREMIINAFKDKIFPLYYPYDYLEDDSSKKDSEDDELLESKGSTNRSDKLLITLDEIFSPDLIEKYFGSKSLREMVRQLKDMRHQNQISARDAKITLIETGLLKLKTDIKSMSEDEAKNKGLDLLKHIVQKILDINKLIDMPELETEEFDEQRRNQQGQGLKILTPKQMIIRLPVLLVQLKAGNNSERLKSEIRQIVYSLSRLRNLSKTIYNNLVNAI